MVAGDAMDDANFVHTTANGAILRITRELAWIEETLASIDSLRDGPPSSFSDRCAVGWSSDAHMAEKCTEQSAITVEGCMVL